MRAQVALLGVIVMLLCVILIQSANRLEAEDQLRYMQVISDEYRAIASDCSMLQNFNAAFNIVPERTQ